MAATITHSFPISTSPVMEVQIRTKKGFQKAILKLFDPRFGALRRGAKSPHTQLVEAAWHDYVRNGSANLLFHRLKRKDKEDGAYMYHYPDSDDERPEWEKLGETEGIIRHQVQNFYTSEVQAYKQLQKFQGLCIPRFISSVTLETPPTPSNLPPIYFQIHGVLLQRIRGFSLTDLVSNIPNQPLLWEEIIQSAVDAAREFNRAGVLNFDSSPRNVIVARLDERTFQPFLIDFAQCNFEWEYDDTDDMWDEKGWKRNVHMCGNHLDYWVISKTIERETGHKLRINTDDIY